jgi:hypothetical protein
VVTGDVPESIADEARRYGPLAAILGSARILDEIEHEQLWDWSGYPRALDGGDIVHSIGDLSLFLGGDRTSFTRDLLALFAKAQGTPLNFNRLALVFPRQCAAWVMWQAMAPVSAADLARLLGQAHAVLRPIREEDQE